MTRALAYLLPVVALGVVTLTIRHDYDQVHREASVRYADANCDGFISTAENEAFTQAFIEGKDATYDSNFGLRSAKGDRVLVWTRKKWINDYVSTHEPVCTPLVK